MSRLGDLRLERCQPLLDWLSALRFAQHLSDGLPREQEPQVHPEQPAEALALGLEPLRHLAAMAELVENGAAARRERSVRAPIRVVEAIEQRGESCAPTRARVRSAGRRRRCAETGIGREQRQVAELQAGAQHPEAGVGDAEQRERAKANPVRRHEHAERSGVERRPHVVEHPVRLRHQ